MGVVIVGCNFCSSGDIYDPITEGKINSVIILNPVLVCCKRVFVCAYHQCVLTEWVFVNLTVVLFFLFSQLPVIVFPKHSVVVKGDGSVNRVKRDWVIPPVNVLENSRKQFPEELVKVSTHAEQLIARKHTLKINGDSFIRFN